MKQIAVLPGDSIRPVIRQALRNIPCQFTFNSCTITVDEKYQGADVYDAEEHLYKVYQSGLTGKPVPVWKSGIAKVQEKPCKNCGRNCFLTDKACWWCELPNPTRA